MWLYICVTSSGVDVVCWGDAVGPVMWVIHLFCGNEGLDGGAVSVRYDRCSCKLKDVCLVDVCVPDGVD